MPTLFSDPFPRFYSWVYVNNLKLKVKMIKSYLVIKWKNRKNPQITSNREKLVVSIMLLVQTIIVAIWYAMGFPGGSDGEESTCNAGDPGFIPGSGRSPAEGNGYPLQYSCLENFKNLRKWNKPVIFKLKKKSDQDCLVVQWLRITLSMQEAWVWSLVRELDSTCCN